MLGQGIEKRLVGVAVLILAVHSAAVAQQNMQPGMGNNNPAMGNSGGGNIYMPPEKATPTQLKAHIEKMQKVAPAGRQTGYGEAMVTASDRILESNPPESLRAFAAVSLMDGLHQWADADHNTPADQRLAELATKYLKDSDKKVASTAAFYDLEQRVLKPGDIPSADVPKVLDEVKAALNGRTLNSAKYMRIVNGTSTLINYLGTDEEAEKQFKEFARILEKSNDPALIHLGMQMKTSKRDPKVVPPAEKKEEPAPAAVVDHGIIQLAQAELSPEIAPRQETALKLETARRWTDRVESNLDSLMGSEHDTEYQKEKAAFLAQYPTDPLRWQWNLMDAHRAIGGMKTLQQGTKDAKAALNEVMAASDVPAAVREKASSMMVQLDIFNHLPVDQLLKAYTAHVKEFPKAPSNASLASSILDLATNRQIDEASVALLRDIKEHSGGALATVAGVKIAELEKLLELKKHPLELKFTDVEGNEFNLESYRGKVVVIDFWATWCGPCVAGLPEVIEQYKKYHDLGLEVIGISFDEDKKTLLRFIKDSGMDWVQYFDGKGWQNKFGQEYGIHAIPAMWLIGRDGKVVDFNARAGLPQKISKLLENPQGATTPAGKKPDRY